MRNSFNLNSIIFYLILKYFFLCKKKFLNSFDNKTYLIVFKVIFREYIYVSSRDISKAKFLLLSIFNFSFFFFAVILGHLTQLSPLILFH